ncbi:hypothetical protein NP493_1613g00075 [Ridgeia piscesae]|uniref:DDE-1 domain-containing protein n=1 Tax=Ridgeia piscesae TaxID=27915 RepID=A0AAD9JZA6_RIDPI|nr:hypothetical protein NP493_1613g00075 [Ridgeia piscesae]
MNAAGTYVPPLFVFPRKRMIAFLMNGAPGGSIAGVSQRGSGYIDGDLLMRWLQHVITIAGCTLESRHILLLDGHVSH